MRKVVALLVLALALASPVVAQQVPKQYQPQPNNDPIYNSQTKQDYEANKKRQAEEAAKKDAPLIQKDFKGNVNVHTNPIPGGGGVTVEKRY